jgi:hypothetical protein
MELPFTKEGGSCSISGRVDPALFLTKAGAGARATAFGADGGEAAGSGDELSREHPASRISGKRTGR